MRKYVTFIVSFLMLFISALPISRTTEAKQEEAIAMTKSSSPIILKHADQVFQQNGDDIQMARHHSHRSHYSHRSHHSHYSSRY
jgi:hypothetical protein